MLLVAFLGATDASKLRGAKADHRDLQSVGCITVVGADGIETTQSPCVTTTTTTTAAGQMATAAFGDSDSNSKSKSSSKSSDDVGAVVSSTFQQGEEMEATATVTGTSTTTVTGTSTTTGTTTVTAENVVVGSEAAPSDFKNIADLAATTQGLQSVYILALTSGLTSTLSGEGPFTLFAPLNSAFPMGQDFLTFQSTTPIDDVRNILTYHVVPGIYRAADLVDGQTLTTVQGGTITVSLGLSTKINEATVRETDIEASNGIVHVIDTMLTPA